MSRAKSIMLGSDSWTALLLYLLGFVSIGFLLAIPSDPSQIQALGGAIVGLLVLAWAGSDAGAGSRGRAFVAAVIGAAIMAGALGWATSLAEARVASAAVTAAFVWGIAWLAAVGEEEAFPMAVALIVAALIAGVANVSILVIGIVFNFITCTSPEVGERLGKRLSSLSTFLILTAIAGLGLALGWVWQRFF